MKGLSAPAVSRGMPTAIGETAICPVLGCGRTLTLAPKPGYPYRSIAVCDCERHRGVHVLEADRLVTPSDDRGPDAALAGEPKTEQED